VSLIFLDACAIIYMIEGADPWATRLRNTLIRLREDDPDIGVAVSDLSRLECRIRPIRQGQHDLLALYDAFFSTDDLTIVPLSPKIIDLATSIRARAKMRTPDALQAACCLSLPQSCRFITNDAAFEREPALDILLI
jgi:predicted nucleic acid-binding protein